MLRREGNPEQIRQEVLNDNGEFAGRVDLIYPERRLIIEVQSHRWHSDRSTGDADSERTNRHQRWGRSRWRPGTPCCATRAARNS